MGVETALLVLAAAGAATSAYSSIQAGKQAKEASVIEGQQISTEAGQEQDAATARADRIRKAGMAQAAEAKTALSASGVSADEGSALKIQEEIIKQSESDALNTIIGGERRSDSLDTQAVLTRKRGKSAQQAGYLNAAGTLLSTAGSYAKASGWKGGGTGSAVKVNG